MSRKYKFHEKSGVSTYAYVELASIIDNKYGESLGLAFYEDIKNGL